MEVINDSSPGLAVESMRDDIEEIRGSMTVNHHVTEDLRGAIADLSGQILDISQPGPMISSPTRNQEPSESVRHEQDIIGFLQ